LRQRVQRDDDPPTGQCRRRQQNQSHRGQRETDHCSTCHWFLLLNTKTRLLVTLQCGWVILEGRPPQTPPFPEPRTKNREPIEYKAPGYFQCGWVILEGRPPQTPPFPEPRTKNREPRMV